MAWNGSGVFSRLYSWVTDASNSIPITASRMDSDTNDIVTGLNNCLTRDGQATPTTNLPMAGYRHTGAANGQARSDYATVAQLQDGGPVWLTGVTGTDTITATVTPAFGSYTAGQSFRFIAAGDNAGTSVTLNINSVGAASVTKTGSTALAAGDLKSGAVITVTYDGSRFQVISGAGGASTANMTTQVANGGAASYTLTGAPGTVGNLQVFVNGLRQTPTVDYTLSGVTVTPTTVWPSGTGNVLFAWAGTLSIGTPADGTVTTAKLDPAGVALPSGSTATTQTPADNSTKVATTAYADAAALAKYAPPVRQTVLSGPVDSNGFSAFGGSTGSTTVTASGTLKVTAAAGGDANYTGSVTNPSWSGLSTNGTMYLYLDVTSAGVVTTGSVTLAPVYQWGGTYSTTSNQHTFNIQEMTMKLGNGSTAVQAYRVFVGEVTVAAGVVSAIVWYQLMGRYFAAWTNTLPSSSTSFSSNHNLGLIDFNGRLQLKCLTTDNGYSVGDIVEYSGAGFSGTTSPATYFIRRQRLSMSSATSNAVACWYMTPAGGGAPASLTLANWAYRFIANRDW